MITTTTTTKSLKSGLKILIFITELLEFKISGVLNTIQNNDIKKKKTTKSRTRGGQNRVSIYVKKA